MSGDSNITNKAPKAASIRAMTSAYGRRIPLVYGRARVQANVIYYTDFIATENKTKTKSGGKGGGGVTQTNINYTYEVCALFALCEGVVSEVSTIWVGKQKGALTDFGLSAFLGSSSQSALGYISTNHPTEATPYRHTSYIGAAKFFLGDDPSIPNVNAEVRGRMANIDINGTGQWDANPANVILDLITDPKACLGLTLVTSGLADNVKTYCQAMGVYVSPVYTEAKPARDMIKALCDIANTAVYFSEGLIKFVPLYDKTVTSGAITFTPNLTPVYAVTTNDILDDGSIAVTRKAQDDCYNMVNVNYQNRAIEYNDDVQPAFDQSSIELHGLRPMSDLNYPEIVNSEVAKLVGQQAIQRSNAIKATYEFKLGWQYSRLEPTDIITITDASLGLNAKAVRILQVDEDDDGISIKAEELLAGALAPARYTTQESDGYLVDYNTPAGNVNTPFIFDVPTSLSNSPEVWMAVSGVGEDNWGGCNVWVSEDNSTYKRIGTISGAARHGVTTATLPSGSAIDTTNTLAVSLISQGEQLDSGTTQAALDLETLMLVEDELLAYRDATLTGTDTYNLQYLVRGAYGSPIKSHASGVKFARLDNMIFKYSYDPDVWLARTMYIKFQSFNIYGSAFQDLASITAYTHDIANVGTQIGSVANLVLTQPFVGDYVRVKWDAVKGATNYQVEVRNLAGSTTYRTVLTYETQFEYSWQDSKADGGPYRDLRVYVKALSANGESGNYSFVSAQNPVPAALTGISITGGYGVIFFEWNPDSSPDILGYQVWMSASSGFTPGSGNLLYDGTDNKGSTRTLPIPAGGAAIAAGSTYYFRIAAYDKYGKTGLNVSSEFSATVLAIAAGIQPGEITATMIASGALDMTKFASGIRPPRVVTSLPTIDGTVYKNQDTVLLTSDGKLYRAVSGSWTKETDGADLKANSILAGSVSAGAIGTTQLAANAVTAEKLLIRSANGCLNDDPYFADVSAWTYSDTVYYGTGAGGAAVSPVYIAVSSGTDKFATSVRTVNIDPAKTYLLTAMIYAPNTNNRNMYLFVEFYDGAGSYVSSAVTGWGGSKSGYVYGNAPSSGDWERVGGQFGAGTPRAIPQSVKTARIGVWFQYSGGGSSSVVQGCQDLRIEEAVGATLIKDGAITTDKIAANTITGDKISANTITATNIAGNTITGDKVAANTITATNIDSRGLTIKDAGGTTIFSAGVPLAATYADNALKNSSITVDGSGNLNGIGSGSGISVANNIDGIIRQPGGGIFTTTTNTYNGALKIRLPQFFTNTMIKFSVSIYEFNAGYSCDLEIAGYNYLPALEWYNTTAKVIGGNVEYPVYFGHDGTYCCIWIGINSETWSYPQVHVRDVLLGYANGSRAQWESGWAISFDTTALGYGTGANQYSSSVLDTLPGADWSKTARRPANIAALTGSEGILNGAITLNSNGTINGAGGGAVTIGGLGYSGDLNATYGATIGTNLSGQITHANSSTFIANAAILSAMIDTLHANKIIAGTITTDKIQVGAISASTLYAASHAVSYPSSSSIWNRTDVVGNFTSSGVAANITGTVHIGCGDNSGFGVSLSSGMVGGSVECRIELIIDSGSPIILQASRVIVPAAGSGSLIMSMACIPITWRGVLAAGTRQISIKSIATFRNSSGIGTSTVGSFVVASDVIILENKV